MKKVPAGTLMDLNWVANTVIYNMPGDALSIRRSAR